MERFCIRETGTGLLLTGSFCFDPAATLDCGQAFRWEQPEPGLFRGVVSGRMLEIRQRGEGFFLEQTTRADWETVWRGYFDMDRDYEEICGRFSNDPVLSKAVAACPGIRLLRQEPWEALCSFILSQNNNIPRIKGIIARLCACFGEPVGADAFSFPGADRLAELDEGALAPLRAGFRASYVLDAARRVASGEIDLEALRAAPLAQAREQLMRIRGVGPKVAECALLYGCGRVDAFPVDVWVKRILAQWYPQGLPICTLGVEGIAQQYLFHYRRTVPDARQAV